MCIHLGLKKQFATGGVPQEGGAVMSEEEKEAIRKQMEEEMQVNTRIRTLHSMHVRIMILHYMDTYIRVYMHKYTHTCIHLYIHIHS